MRAFIYSFILIAVITGVVLYYSKLDAFQKERSVITAKMNYVLNSKEYNDILFIGSSRTFVHINPAIIDSVCKTSSYNLGLDGSSIAEQKMILEQYCRFHPQPKAVMLSLDFLTFNTGTDVYNYPDYFAYTKHSREIKERLSAIHSVYNYPLFYPFHRLKQLSEINDSVKLKVLFTPAAAFKTETERIEKSQMGTYIRGFRANLTDVIVDTTIKKINFQAPVTNEGQKLLDDFISFCRGKKISLFFLYPPAFNGIKNKIEGYGMMDTCFRDIGAKNYIKLFDFSEGQLSRRMELFYNYEHLNAKGAALFSKELADTLRNYFQGQ